MKKGTLNSHRKSYGILVVYFFLHRSIFLKNLKTKMQINPERNILMKQRNIYLIYLIYLILYHAFYEYCNRNLKLLLLIELKKFGKELIDQIRTFSTLLSMNQVPPSIQQLPIINTFKREILKGKIRMMFCNNIDNLCSCCCCNRRSRMGFSHGHQKEFQLYPALIFESLKVLMHLLQ